MPRAFQSPARDSKERARDTRRCIGSCLSKMSRAVLLCCTTLALLFSVGAAHAQQGNLPTPVQKLPAYPPVACVTPDWRPEPCEDRNANRIGWWQCGNVQVTVLLKDDVSVEYRVTGIEKSNNRFLLRPKDELYLNGKLCTPLGEFGKAKPQAPPATTQLPEPVKCLKPDGTEEPCESRHAAQPLTPTPGQYRTDPKHGNYRIDPIFYSEFGRLWDELPLWLLNSVLSQETAITRRLARPPSNRIRAPEKSACLKWPKDDGFLGGLWQFFHTLDCFMAGDCGSCGRPVYAAH
jgi:hypothetical protein